MLTKELIQKNEALKGLTEEQVAAIAELSKNDEAEVIGNKVAEIHGQYDADIESVTGQKKPADRKTYAFLKEVLAGLKSKAEEGPKALQEEVEKLKAQNAGLEKKIKEGRADDHLKDKVSTLEKEKGDLEGRIGDLQKELERKGAEWKAKLAEKEAALAGKDIEFQFANDLAGMKFKDEKFIPLPVRQTYIAAAKTNILSRYDTEYIDDGRGGSRLVFRDKKTGKVMNNPENQLNPFTSAELLKKELEPVLDTGRQQNGAGTGGNGAPADLILSIAGARNQREAQAAIDAHLLAKGLEKGTPAWMAESKKIREENEVGKLPLGIV